MNSMRDIASIENSKTFDCKVGFPIQCFTINNAGNKVIVAGKVQCELYAIDYDKFSIKSKFALKKAINLCIMDISWSRIEESLVVSCGSNGELYKLMVTATDLALDTSFKFHERTINKIDFHPNEANILISGGQDGIIKLIDFRQRTDSAALTFRHDNDDKVTDIQFNPSLSMRYQFASGSESGFAFTWDYRYPSKYEKKLNPHLGGVHLDWHPEEKYWLATASRDRQICVYDLSISSERSNLINTLTHSESVTSIRWRPKRPTQITACSSGFDAHLYVWHLMRPYVPYLSFDSLTNKVQNFMWRNSPKVLIASTREQIHNINTCDVIRPADYSTLVSIQMDRHGSVVFAVGVDNEKSNQPEFGITNFPNTLTNPTSLIQPNNPLNITSSLLTDNKSSQIENISATVQQIAGSYGSISLNANNLSTKSNSECQSNDSDNNVEKFRITKSILYCSDQIQSTRSDWFYHAAKNYKFKDENFEDLCEHNARVCLSFKKFNIYKDWMILKTIYSDSSKNINFREPVSTNVNQTNIHHQVQTLNSSAAVSNTNRNVLTDTETFANLNLNIGLATQINNMIVPVTTLTNLNPSSSSSNSSGPTSSSSGLNTANYNSSRIRHFSENSNDDAIIGANTNSILVVNNPGSVKTSREQNLYQSNQIDSLNNLDGYLTTNNLLNIMNNGDQNDDDLFSSNNILNRFDEEEDYSQLPNDIIEYNDELSNDYFSCEKILRGFNTDNDLNLKLNLPRTDNLINRNQLDQINPNIFKSHIMQSKPRQPIFDLNISNENINLSSNTNAIGNQRINNSDGLLQTVPPSSIDSKTVNDLTETNKFLDENFLKNISNFTPNELSTVDFSNYFQQLLTSYVNEENDLTTAIFMYLVATLNHKFDPNKIDSICLDEWFSQYIELLSMFDLWNLRIDIIKHYQSDFIKNLTQNSINYNVMCASCKKTIKQNTFICPYCNRNVFLCVYCHLPVKRLYAWCHNCCHGGHLHHLIKWFKNNSICPSGCGCRCRF